MSKKSSKISEDKKALFIIKSVEKHMGISFESFNVKGREVKLALPRQMCIYFLYKYTDFGQAEVSKLFNRNHSTVVHSIKVIDEYVETRGDISIIFNSILKGISYYAINKDKKSIIIHPTEDEIMKQSKDSVLSGVEPYSYESGARWMLSQIKLKNNF